MKQTFRFWPDPKRAVALDRHMRERLDSSLRYIVEQVRGRILFDKTALDGFFKRLARGPVHALTFGAYCDLVLAIDDDQLDLAQVLLTEIAAAQNRPAGLLITDLADPQLDAAADRFVRLIDTDPNISFAIIPPPSEVAAQCRQRIAAGLRLLEAGAPTLAEEIVALVGEIVIAVGPDDAKAMTFDGASSFMLWGAILLNAKGHNTVLEAAQALVHESGHNLLFGLCADGPLIYNDDSPIYASPLRTDPRPMDGVVHATYVTARMHWAVTQMRQAGVLDEAATAEAHDSLAAHCLAFAHGIDLIDRHAHLTERGQAIIVGARAYMEQSA
jgi:HEXXH motif-containing protein